MFESKNLCIQCEYIKILEALWKKKYSRNSEAFLLLCLVTVDKGYIVIQGGSTQKPDELMILESKNR